MSATGLARWLTLLALLLVPFAMTGESAAHARPAVEGHCAGTEKPDEAPLSAPADCMIACAGCLPTQGASLAARIRLQPAAEPAPIAFRIRGLHPEAATPPPRSS